uniref:Uncharacterized protein n=1 Tax=Pararge aegeria TaxID=116150 RepID=S4P6M3_9NEOP
MSSRQSHKSEGLTKCAKNGPFENNAGWNGIIYEILLHNKNIVYVAKVKTVHETLFFIVAVCRGINLTSQNQRPAAVLCNFSDELPTDRLRVILII